VFADARALGVAVFCTLCIAGRGVRCSGERETMTDQQRQYERRRCGFANVHVHPYLVKMSFPAQSVSYFLQCINRPAEMLAAS
jgi:hypothetical protein